MATCPACRSDIPDDSRFCDQCGFRLTPYPIQPLSEPPPTGLPSSPANLDVRLLTQRRDGGRERRSTMRFPLEVEVTYQSEHNFYTGLASNLSTGGLFVATHQPATLGDILEVTFTLPGLDHVCTARCEVRWTRDFDPNNLEVPPGLGLRFTELEPQVWSCIELFVRHREPIFFDDDEN
jgi:uncharacterized protein (TIGR02266 family)